MVTEDVTEQFMEEQKRQGGSEPHDVIVSIFETVLGHVPVDIALLSAYPNTDIKKYFMVWRVAGKKPKFVTSVACHVSN